MPNVADPKVAIAKFTLEFHAQALDLTLRNPLLRLPTAERSVRFLELPSNQMQLIVDALIGAERSITFVGKDASATELRLAADSARPGSTDMLRVVVDLKHERVESILRSIAGRHDDLIEKRGLPCGYIALGVLEWTPDDRKETRSPLLLLPVEIDEEQDSKLLKTIYKVTLADRSPCENPALREYMRRKYELLLPKFEESEIPQVAHVQKWLDETILPFTATKPDWRLVGGATFGLFDCGAIAADCDGGNWNPPLHDRELIKKVLLSTDVAGNDLEEVEFCSPSLVLNADGSQFDAIRQVEQGKNIVLHGPPGSGKSETIVNLIASAFHAGKSVLFVAQKPEAARVVCRRLAKCGLDPFCTVLVPVGESRNTKSSVLDGLRRRVAIRPTREALLQPQLSRLRDRVNLLNEHATALGMVLPVFEMTARDVLAELAVFSLAGVSAATGTEVNLPASRSNFTTAEDALAGLATARKEISDDAFETLGGLRTTDDQMMAHDAAFRLTDDLKRLRTSCTALAVAVARVTVPGAESVPTRVSLLNELAFTMPRHAELADGQFLGRAFRLQALGAAEALARIAQVRAFLGQVQRRFPNCRELIKRDVFGPRGEANSLESVLRKFSVHEQPLSWAIKNVPSIDRVRSGLSGADLIPNCGMISHLLSSADDFHHWQKKVNLVVAIGQAAGGREFLLKHAKCAPTDAQCLLEAKEKATRVTDLRLEGGRICLAERLTDRQSLVFAQSAIAMRRSLASRVFGTITDSRYRSAKKTALHCLLPGVSRGQWPEALSACIELHDAEAAWILASERIGPTATEAADPASWQAAHEWFQRILDLARQARVSIDEAWELARSFETQSVAQQESAMVSVAQQICKASWIANGLTQSLAGEQVTPGTVADSLAALSKVLAHTTVLAAELGFGQSVQLVQVVQSAGEIVELRESIRALDVDVCAAALMRDDFRGVDSITDAYDDTLGWAKAWADPKRGRWLGILQWVLAEQASLDERGSAAHSLAESLTQDLPSVLNALGSIRKHYTFDGASSRLRFGDGLTLAENIQFAEGLFKFESSIYSIFSFGQLCRRAGELAGVGIVQKLFDRDFQVGTLVRTYRRTVFELSLGADNRFAGLLQVGRVALESAIGSLPNLEQELRDGNAKKIVNALLGRSVPSGIANGLVREKTELGYVNHLLGLQRPRFEVQDLFQRSRAALSALQPCVIATPDSVSEFLPRDGGMFDLLIMDEASQVPPSNAFGSIARARQAVIVGDPKQLPPTSFFAGAAPGANEAEDEDAQGVTDVESILDRAISSLKSVHLCGHYRSRHHSLIAFSNKHFYDERLAVTPSVAGRDGKFGIVAHYLRDAQYSAGINEIEAKAVAVRAMTHLRSGTDESLGIVAFNRAQADLIKMQLELLAHEDSTNTDAYARARNAKDPIFIRNLESVQGDERDVIYISYTYGPDAMTGQVAQRFGPVGNQGGERRLNVLVTRAKNRVEVFHSMLPEQLTGTSPGARVMREYLEYARKTPEFDFIDGDHESEFERQVARAIESFPMDLIVRPQVSCNRFRIDMGISLRTNPGRFILGIECDGAAYHSSRDARDRDLTRQMILEHHGWVIHRVWSTAWWKNPTEELKRLESAVREAMKRDAARRLAAGETRVG